MQLLVAEEEEDEEVLRAQLGTRLLVLPDYLPGLFVGFQDGHGYHHRSPHEFLNLEVVGHPPLVYGVPLTLLQQQDLEEHAQRF